MSSAGQGDNISVSRGEEGNTIDISSGRSKRGIDSAASLSGICIYKDMSKIQLSLSQFTSGILLSR